MVWMLAVIVQLQHQQMVVLDVKAITADFIVSLQQKKLNDNEQKKAIDAFSLQLSKTVNEMAEQHNWVVLPAQAVIAGQKDITSEVILKMRDKPE